MRLQKGLRQKARQLKMDETKIDGICEQVAQLNELSALSNAMKYRIGCALLSEGKIIAPACPDYSHSDGRYTFDSVGGGVSLLTELHIKFLHKVVKIIPDCQITILLADHEAQDAALCKAIGKTKEEFANLINQSVENTAKLVAPYDWQVLAMTKVIPNLVKQELKNMAYINSEKKFRIKINYDMASRTEMYHQINSSFTEKEMLQRTLKTAAQYLAMGQFATANNIIVCNHSTVNLCWYKEACTAVLHNPVTVY